MDDLTTRVAKLLWAKLPAPQTCPDEIDEAARAVVALVLDKAARVAQSADTPIFKDGWTSRQDAAAISAMQSIAAAIRALGVQS